MAVTTESPGKPSCVHGAQPGECAFVGCPHFRPDGPRDERWAFRPGTTEADIKAALAENAADLERGKEHGFQYCASPIHLVVERHRVHRIEVEAGRMIRCPTCGTVVPKETP